MILVFYAQCARYRSVTPVRARRRKTFLQKNQKSAKKIKIPLDKGKKKRVLYKTIPSRGGAVRSARRAHNPKVVWFKSCPRNHKKKASHRACFLFMCLCPTRAQLRLNACVQHHFSRQRKHRFRQRRNVSMSARFVCDFFFLRPARRRQKIGR